MYSNKIVYNIVEIQDFQILPTESYIVAYIWNNNC